MQDIGNDMDDLFKRAGEDYPLKPGRDNWERILPQLDQQQKKRRPALVFLFFAGFSLLLVGTGLGVSLYKMYDQGNKNKVASTAQASKIIKKLNDKHPKSYDIVKPHETAKPPIGTSTLFGLSLPKSSNPLSAIGLNKSKSANRRQVDLNSNIKTFTTTHKTTAKTILAVYQNTPSNNLAKLNKPPLAETNLLEAGKLLGNNLFELPRHSNLNISQKNKLLSVDNNIVKEIKTKLNGKFYLQPVASINISHVKNSGIEKVGEDLGLLAGYKISRKLSIETGVIVGRKVVKVSGDNFSKDKIGSMLLIGMKLMDVQCNANLIEIPILIRYDLFQKNGTKVFAKAGVSTFVLTQEKNSYHTFYNGVEQILYGKYRDNRLYYAAVINLSAGFEIKVAKSTSLIIEPNIQLPTTTIGVGSLPISTGGVRFGVKFPLR